MALTLSFTAFAAEMGIRSMVVDRAGEAYFMLGFSPTAGAYRVLSLADGELHVQANDLYLATVGVGKLAYIITCEGEVDQVCEDEAAAAAALCERQSYERTAYCYVMPWGTQYAFIDAYPEPQEAHPYAF